MVCQVGASAESAVQCRLQMKTNAADQSMCYFTAMLPKPGIGPGSVGSNYWPNGYVSGFSNEGFRFATYCQ